MLLLLPLLLATAAAAAPPPPPPPTTSSLLTPLNIDRTRVIAAGLGHSGDFSHQLHVAYSSIFQGSCVFAGQPLHCAVSSFPQDIQVVRSNNTRVPICNGCKPNMTLPFDHCRRTPHVVDVGSLVDYPRRSCGQNPISNDACFDDVDFMKRARVFLFRGTKDVDCAAGSIENVAALVAQMMEDPERDIQIVNDQPIPHVLPILPNDGYDGPGQCLRHVFDAPWMEAGHIVESSWSTFDQTEFTSDMPAAGFQVTGWMYVPERCHPASGDLVCGLVVRPDTCSSDKRADDVDAFAAYAEGNGLIVLHPCTGGAVDIKTYPHAPDIQDGKLDVFGQLSSSYTWQEAPHMRVVGDMVRRVLGMPAKNRTGTAVKKSVPENMPEKMTDEPPPYITLPNLNIAPGQVMTAGCSNDADFAHQLHVGFSSLVKGSCIFSGMPYHCAVTRFKRDYMVPKTRATYAGIACDGCDDNGTLIYDHCKNHPRWVNVGQLQEYAETALHVDDPTIHLKNARVFSFGGSHDRCYQVPAMENVANFHLKYAQDAMQIKLVENLPFPHTLPTNETAYFNDVGNTTGAGYDGPGECLRHVVGNGTRLWASPFVNASWWYRVNATEYVTDQGVGLKNFVFLFVPPQCQQEEGGGCRLLVLPSGCNAKKGGLPTGGSDGAFAQYAQVNNIVILKTCHGAPIDVKRFPDNHENLRGLADVYGQLGDEYATQRGGAMEPTGKMIKRLLGMME